LMINWYQKNHVFSFKLQSMHVYYSADRIKKLLKHHLYWA